MENQKVQLKLIVPQEFKLSIEKAARERNMTTTTYVTNTLQTSLETPILSNYEVQQHIILAYSHITNMENNLKLYHPTINLSELEAAKNELTSIKNCSK